MAELVRVPRAEVADTVRELEQLVDRLQEQMAGTEHALGKEYRAVLRERLTRLTSEVGDLKLNDNGRFEVGRANTVAISKLKLEEAKAGKLAARRVWNDWRLRLEELASNTTEYSQAFDRDANVNRELLKALLGQFPKQGTPVEGLAARFFQLTERQRGQVADVITRNVVGASNRRTLVKELAEEMGTAESYAERLFRDGTQQFNRQVLSAQAERANLEWFIYRGPQDGVTRPFCSPLVGKIRSRDEIEAMDNGQTGAGSVMVAGGGYNCRHRWWPVDPAWYRDEEWSDRTGGKKRPVADDGATGADVPIADQEPLDPPVSPQQTINLPNGESQVIPRWLDETDSFDNDSGEWKEVRDGVFRKVGEFGQGTGKFASQPRRLIVGGDGIPVDQLAGIKPGSHETIYLTKDGRALRLWRDKDRIKRKGPRDLRDDGVDMRWEVLDLDGNVTETLYTRHDTLSSTLTNGKVRAAELGRVAKKYDDDELYRGLKLFDKQEYKGKGTTMDLADWSSRLVEGLEGAGSKTVSRDLLMLNSPKVWSERFIRSLGNDHLERALLRVERFVPEQVIKHVDETIEKLREEFRGWDKAMAFIEDGYNVPPAIARECAFELNEALKDREKGFNIEAAPSNFMPSLNPTADVEQMSPVGTSKKVPEIAAEAQERLSLLAKKWHLSESRASQGIKLEFINTRASFNKSSQRVSVGRQGSEIATRKTQLHELGHWLEHHSEDLKETTQAYLWGKIEESEAELGELYSGSYEFYAKGMPWKEKYAAKLYNQKLDTATASRLGDKVTDVFDQSDLSLGSTEVNTMALQEWTDIGSMSKQLRSDPELFKWAVYVVFGGPPP